MEKPVYRVPQKGTYTVSATLYKQVLNGKKKWVSNRKWWQFWKPKMKEVDDYDIVQSNYSYTDNYNVGDIIEPPAHDLLSITKDTE